MGSESWPVLTIRQPWEWAIEHGGKPVENRPRRMLHRGPVLLHAGARSRWDRNGEASALVREAWRVYRHEKLPDWPGLPASDVALNRKTTLIRFGAVSAVAEVTGCHHADECYQLADDEAGRWPLCSPWAAFAQFHIELSGIRTLPEPLPCRGQLGLWRLPEDAEKAVRMQLEAQK